jgi:uncharacterized protein (UPF0548 family)
MTFTFNIPSQQKTTIFIAGQKKLDFTYEALEATLGENKIEGFDNDFQKVVIGKGETAFRKAKLAIQKWQMFPSTWTKILPEDTPIQKSEIVAMYAQFLGIWCGNACKIVYVIDEKNRFGFAYGTLPGHIERGEELFLVELLDNGDVEYTIKAFSRPRHILAKIGYPIIRVLQEKFRQDSAKQMENIVNQSN